MSTTTFWEQRDLKIDTLAGRIFAPQTLKASPPVLVLGGSEGAFGWSNTMGFCTVRPKRDKYKDEKAATDA
ncbi:MAG: hypothetical protein R3C14_05055 [Caldilineaceae bacterium]